MNLNIYRTIATRYILSYDGTTSTTWRAQRRQTTRFLFGLITYTRWVYLKAFGYTGESVRTFQSEEEAWAACRADQAARDHGVKTIVGRVGDPSLADVSVSVPTNLGTNQ